MPHLGWILGSIGSAAGIFVLDLQTPLGIATPMLYVLPVLLAAWLVPTPASTSVATIAALLLTWLGAVLSSGELTSQALTNRLITSVLLVLVYGLVTQQKRLVQERAAAQDALHGSEAQLRDATSTIEQRDHKLTEAHQRWELAMRATHDGVWDWDVTNNAVYCSRRWKDIHGFQERDPPESVQDWPARIHPDDRARVTAQWRAYVDLLAPHFREEYRIRRKDGAYIWVLDRRVLVQNDRGQVVRVVSAHTDITWAETAQERLRTVAARERMLLRAAPVVIYTCQASEPYAATSVSENVVELLGYRPQEFTERADFWLSHIHPDDQAQVLASLTGLLQTRRQVVEYRFSRKDGSYRWLHDEVQVMPHVDGTPEELIGFQIDITAHKETEAALREREEQLRRLSARLLEVQEDERRRLARELHDDFTQRLAALAIEIHGVCAAEHSGKTGLASRLAQLRQNVEDLARDLQRVAHQLHPSILEHVGLEAAVREHVDEFASRTGLKAETIMRDVPGQVPREHATCLYRVLQESLQNVRKHANATHVLVRLLRTGRGLGLCIHDDGRGFENTHHASRRGLGLTSMAERVAHVNGTFQIRTKPGDGTEVHVWVPFDRATDGAPDANRPA